MIHYNEIKHYEKLVQGYKRTVSNWTGWNDKKVKFFTKKLNQTQKKLTQLQDDYGNELYERMRDEGYYDSQF